MRISQLREQSFRLIIFLYYGAFDKSSVSFWSLSWNKDGWGDTTRAPIVAMIFLYIIKNEKAMRSHWKMLKFALVKSSSAKIWYNGQSPI